MHSVHGDTLAFTSRHMFDDHWSTPLGTCSFPTSDLRSVDWLCTSTPPITPSLRNLTPSERTTSGNLRTSKYSHFASSRTQIEPGVWSDGSNRVLSAACPDVQTFLTSAREEMNLPIAPFETVFALAALEVFYRVDDPVHWMFWNEKAKDETAEVVNRISLHRPPLIHSRVAWNGVSEYLFILASLHGPTSSPLYEAKEWYPILNPPKATSPPRVPNLRKRKPHQAGLRETPGSVDQEVDEEEPPTKRPRTKRILNSKKSRASKAADDRLINERHAEVSPATSSTPLPSTDLDGVSIPIGCLELPVEEPPSLTTRGPARNPKRKAHTPVSSISTASSAIPTPPFATPASHSRNRSTSQTSNKTLVAERRSASVSSALTAVEVLAAEKDGMLEGKSDQADDPSESEGKPDFESGMVTRGRASKASTTEGKGKVMKTTTRSRPKAKAKRNAK